MNNHREDVEGLVRRLREEVPKGMLSGCCDTIEPRNPDGPEAADALEALTAKIAGLEGALSDIIAQEVENRFAPLIGVKEIARAALAEARGEA